MNHSQVATSDVTLPKNEYQLAHDRASFLSGQKVQKLMEQGGRTGREITGGSKECRERERAREREGARRNGKERESGMLSLGNIIV